MTERAFPPRAIAFDFDGTLVDSAPGILTGMRLALEKNSIAPRVALDPGIIGPPLKQTLSLISGSQDEALLAQLVHDFKLCYDSTAYRDTAPYPGITTLLTRLAEAGCQLYLATNKRAIPTQLILAHLSWSHLFAAVYCLDEHPTCPDKGQLLAQLLNQHCLKGPGTPYIGDTDGDAHAAALNHMPYIHVGWGYGTAPSPATRCCANTGQLLALMEEQPWT